jgi:hypothetical protein
VKLGNRQSWRGMSRSLLTRVEFEEAKVGRGPQKRKKAETTAPRTTQDAKKKNHAARRTFDRRRRPGTYFDWRQRPRLAFLGNCPPHRHPEFWAPGETQTQASRARLVRPIMGGVLQRDDWNNPLISIELQLRATGARCRDGLQEEEWKQTTVRP